MAHMAIDCPPVTPGKLDAARLIYRIRYTSYRIIFKKFTSS